MKKNSYKLQWRNDADMKEDSWRDGLTIQAKNKHEADETAGQIYGWPSRAVLLTGKEPEDNQKERSMTIWPRVYIAGALNADACQYLKNCARMLDIAEAVRHEGFAVYVPAQDLLMGIKFGNHEYGDYFENSTAWLAVADALFLVPGWENSAGTKKEIEIAKEKNIPIFSKIEDIVKWKTTRRTK